MAEQEWKDIAAAGGYEIDWIGGNCPVQAEGSIPHVGRFYFRARGESWRVEIGFHPDWDASRDEPDWEYEEEYGNWPEAGWMPESEAIAFLDKAINLYRGTLPPAPNGE